MEESEIHGNVSDQLFKYKPTSVRPTEVLFLVVFVAGLP
jgi:hypothetical protein